MSKYDSPWLARLAVPGVCLLIAFLSYSSQWMFKSLEPGPLTNGQSLRFNVLVACIWICYARACLTDPGHVPADWTPTTQIGIDGQEGSSKGRFCRKCNAPKPPRSHHCKVCKRCIPKMDHHCPWTANCVSHFTLPHFMRFLFYAVTSMAYLEHFIYLRGAKLWEDRNVPAYLGPSAFQLGHLFILFLVNSLTLFLVGIMLLRSTYALATNVMTIEGWEIERHHQLLRRARVLGGHLDGPDGIRVQITRHEFPYDIGIWQNIAQNMGTRNVLTWFWPFAATIKSGGLAFETNGFEEPGQSWPPPDPDRMPRRPREEKAGNGFTFESEHMTPDERIAAFKHRQQLDMLRRLGENDIHRRKPFRDRFGQDGTPAFHDDEYYEDDDGSLGGEEDWQDSGGNRLEDYGVEKDVEFYDEDDIPVAELLRRRKQQQQL